MKRKILQKIANSILFGLEKSNSNQMVEFYVELGMWYDTMVDFYFDIELE